MLLPRNVLLLVVFAGIVLTIGTSLLLRTPIQEEQLEITRHPLGTLNTARPDASDRLKAWFTTVQGPGEHGRSRLATHNARMLREMLDCMQTGTCALNQFKDKVVILEEPHLLDVVRGTGSIGGELIWANSTVKALGSIGYTYLFVEHWTQGVFYHSLFPDLVVTVVMQSETLVTCWTDKDKCVKSPSNPEGIPVWKLLAYSFWSYNASPLDGRWTISPEPWKADAGAEHPNTYLGYSIEERCSQHKVIPVQEREHRAYVLAKYLRFFVENPFDGAPAWPADIWQTMKDELDVKAVVSIQSDDAVDGSALPAGLPSGIMRLKQLGPDEFVAELGMSRVLVGVGNPVSSPTPYEALCMAVPFINPITSWDRDSPDDASRWSCQHYPLCRLGPGPPYVYNVKKGDRQGFLKAIKAALENPIERHVPERMRQSAVAERLDVILRRDLRETARELLERRMAGLSHGELFEL